jgi:hypothetical protein
MPASSWLDTIRLPCLRWCTMKNEAPRHTLGLRYETLALAMATLGTLVIWTDHLRADRMFTILGYASFAEPAKLHAWYYLPGILLIVGALTLQAKYFWLQRAARRPSR